VIAFFAELIFRMLVHSGRGWSGRHSGDRDERRVRAELRQPSSSLWC
jgi:hypothetical protein